MYGTMACPYCIRARQLLDSKEVAYHWINVADSHELYQDMVQLSSNHTVPQIFIDRQSMGGCDEMYALEREGHLDEMLGLK